MNEPNFYKIRYHTPIGIERGGGYEQIIKTIEIHELEELLYIINDHELIISITPLFITEVEHPTLTKQKIIGMYRTMERNQDIARLNKKLEKGNRIVQEAMQELEKLK